MIRSGVPALLATLALWTAPRLAWGQEVCGNRVDDDLDGALDCLDVDCAGSLPDGDGDGTADPCDVCAAPGDGLETFGGATRSLIAGLENVLEAIAADLDGDGDADVLAAAIEDDNNPMDGRIVGFENRGGGRFGPALLVSEGDHPRALATADLDGDGDADLVGAFSGDDLVGWHENLGGTFGPRQSIGWLDDAMTVSAADLDGDGDIDVLSGGSDGRYPTTNAEFDWHENLGGGVFALPQRLSSQVVGSGWAVDVRAGDLDGDGDADILGAATYGYYDGDLGWFENLGGGTFGAFARLGLGDFLGEVVGADLDADGDDDFLYAAAGTAVVGNTYEDGLGWFESVGGGSFGPVEGISPELTNGGHYTSVDAADLDGDGDLDVLGAARSRSPDLSWHENLGGGAFGPEHAVTGALRGAESVVASDLDGDGDADVLSASSSDGRVAWSENLSECVRLDTDRDGLPDAVEVLRRGTDPALADSDLGGMDDGRELILGQDPLDPADDAPPLTLGAPTPGRAGTNNTWTVTGAEPGATVAVVGGLAVGTTAVPSCPLLSVAVASPVAVGIALADATGTAVVQRLVPAAAAGASVRFQAVDLAACSKSAVRSDTIQ